MKGRRFIIEKVSNGWVVHRYQGCDLKSTGACKHFGEVWQWMSEAPVEEKPPYHGLLPEQRQAGE